MRLNRFIATHSNYSRRKADDLINEGRVMVNRKKAHQGIQVDESDTVLVDGKPLSPTTQEPVTLLIDKPVGYVCSKDGQGSPTVYDLLPKKYRHFNIAGRLDKDSSGLVIVTDNGQLVQELTHPSYNKEKVYEVELNKVLSTADIAKLQSGVKIDDKRLSRLEVEKINTKPKGFHYTVTITEGRNRQIRRTFEAIGRSVRSLRRISMGEYHL